MTEEHPLTCSATRNHLLFNGKLSSLARKSQWSCLVICGCLKHIHEMGGIILPKEVFGEMLKNTLQNHHLLHPVETRSLLASDFSSYICNKRSQANGAGVFYLWTFSFSLYVDNRFHISGRNRTFLCSVAVMGK